MHNGLCNKWQLCSNCHQMVDEWPALWHHERTQILRLFSHWYQWEEPWCLGISPHGHSWGHTWWGEPRAESLQYILKLKNCFHISKSKSCKLTINQKWHLRSQCRPCKEYKFFSLLLSIIMWRHTNDTVPSRCPRSCKWNCASWKMSSSVSQREAPLCPRLTQFSYLSIQCAES